MVAYGYAAAGDLIRDGVNGRLAAFGDEFAFTAIAAATAALDEPSLIRMRAGASQSVTHLDWERIHDGFAAILQGAVASRNCSSQGAGSDVWQGAR